MSSAHANDLPALEYLHMRDELLQIMYWMLGEGLGDQPGVSQIEAFLGANRVVIEDALACMVVEGFVTEDTQGSFRLTELGLHEGKRSFADEFSELTHQGHGECAPDCVFCHSPDGDPSECPSKIHSHAASG